MVLQYVFAILNVMLDNYFQIKDQIILTTKRENCANAF